MCGSLIQSSGQVHKGTVPAAHLGYHETHTWDCVPQGYWQAAVAAEVCTLSQTQCFCLQSQLHRKLKQEVCKFRPRLGDLMRPSLQIKLKRAGVQLRAGHPQFHPQDVDDGVGVNLHTSAVPFHGREHGESEMYPEGRTGETPAGEERENLAGVLSGQKWSQFQAKPGLKSRPTRRVNA